MIAWTFRWATKFAIILIILYAVYLVVTLLFSSSVVRKNCETQYEEEPDSLITSPFVSGQPKLVIVLSYQRSGSSFFGEWFNTNPEVFFNFEPVDSLYSAMYGTNQNRNVPSDITNYKNGTLRQLPDEEIAAVSTFLNQFLLCDMDSMPTQSLINFYFLLTYDHMSTRNYTRCIKTLFLKIFNQCEPHLTKYCGARFGQVPLQQQQECFRRLWNNVDDPSTDSSDRLNVNFTTYRTCVASLRNTLDATCLRLLQDSCRNHSIRVIKTVRATMDSMQPLLEASQNFRVIHLVRDPRAVAASRKRFDGYVLGIYSGNDSKTIVKEAKLYCNTVVRDIKVRKKLEKKYPGKIYSLIFEKLVIDTSLYLNNVYRFLDVTPHPATVKWLSTSGKTSSDSRKTSGQIANDWQNILTFKMNKEIIESCKEFYELAKFQWTL